jgi:hypothetical protein
MAAAAEISTTPPTLRVGRIRVGFMKAVDFRSIEHSREGQVLRCKPSKAQPIHLVNQMLGMGEQVFAVHQTKLGTP